MTDFVTIDRIIKHKWINLYLSLAEEIDARGVYSSQGVFFSANSREAQEAISAIAAMARTCDEFGVEMEYADGVLVEAAKPTSKFGWPKSKLPEFSYSDSLGWVANFFSFAWDIEVHDHPDVPSTYKFYVSREKLIYHRGLYSLSRILLTEKYTTEQIADEIERGGIFGFGSAGRITKFEMGDSSKNCENCIHSLTLFRQRLDEIDKSPAFEMLRDSAYAKFGWRHDNLPIFLRSNLNVEQGVDILKEDPDAIDVDPSEEIKPSKRDEAAIAVLVAYLEGKLTGVAHPDFVKKGAQEFLINFIKAQEIRGLGERGFKTLFGIAHKKFSEEQLQKFRKDFAEKQKIQ
jgi:hypothetical protein